MPVSTTGTDPRCTSSIDDPTKVISPKITPTFSHERHSDNQPTTHRLRPKQNHRPTTTKSKPRHEQPEQPERPSDNQPTSPRLRPKRNHRPTTTKSKPQHEQLDWPSSSLNPKLTPSGGVVGQPNDPTPRSIRTNIPDRNRPVRSPAGGGTKAKPGTPPKAPPTTTRVSWSLPDADGIGTTHDIESVRRNDVSVERTAKRVEKMDRLDRSIIGEFPVPKLAYLPSDVVDILPGRLTGPNDLFDPGTDFLSKILVLMKSQPPTPLAPPFHFSLSPPALAHNAELLEAAGFDFDRLLPTYQESTLGFGSEFRPVKDITPLLHKHPLFPFVAKVLSEGMSYEYNVGEELTESERLVEMAGQLERGNHKSVADELVKVKELLTKDVTHGFTIPFPVECAPQIKGAMIQPLGVVKQGSMNAKGERVEKFRLTQDLSFSLASAHDNSINGRINLQLYPEMVYGWCMPRILHLVSALREEHPGVPIFICKYDYSDAYRRVAHSPKATAQTIAVLDDVAYVSLRLTFGGSPNPPTWCAVSEMVTDLANEIAWCSAWDHGVTHSSMMPSQPLSTKRVAPSVPFACARPMAVHLPSITNGRVDVFVDDVIHVFPDTPGSLERLPHVVPLAMELTSRVHAGQLEPIPRRPILSPEKLAAEGAPAEVQQVLGWTIDTRTLTVSLPADKFSMWVDDIQRVQKARRASTSLLATIEGRLNHTASILPLARHFLTRLRTLKLSTMSANRQYTKLPNEVVADLQLWEKVLAIAHAGVSINVLTTRRPDIIGWSDACPFGMGGYNTAGRAWRLLIDPTSPIFGESRVNNALEYIAMTVNAIASCRDVLNRPSPCVLALGDNTSAIGWLFRSSKLHQPHHSVHLQVARHLAHEMIRNDCCLYSQHLPGTHNVVADLLSYDGRGRDKPHPIAYDQPDDDTLTSRFHASSTYSPQITSNFRICPLPPDINSWLLHTLQMLESYVSAAQNNPSSQLTVPGDDGADICAQLDAPTTRHWTDSQTPLDDSSPRPLSNTYASPSGTTKATPSLVASVRERYYRGLSDKPLASWQRRVGSVSGRAPSTTRRHPTPFFATSTSSSDPSLNGILRRQNNAPSPPNSYDISTDYPDRSPTTLPTVSSPTSLL